MILKYIRYGDAGMRFPVVKSASICLLRFRRTALPSVLLAIGNIFDHNKNSPEPDHRSGAIGIFFFRTRRIQLFQLAFRRNRQFLTTLCTTAGQHFAAICSLHALAETVNGFTTATVWLKCSFHFTIFYDPKK
jgi:hypothetical protein